ncbi:C2H2-type domain-containing protein OS=Streptomyces alboniger OX=132473 GN=CP975_14510 PE=4 SV=1 [Streptomyces alboniger]
MSEIADTGHPVTALNVVHESYAFACMRCGHGWEQSYEIEHHVDGAGQEFVRYLADGRHVPSPLSRPTCLNCGGHVVRIMRAGQVSSVLDCMRRQREDSRVGRQAGPAEPAGATAAAGAEGRERHHWHLSDLLHPFAHRKAEQDSGDRGGARAADRRERGPAS